MWQKTFALSKRIHRLLILLVTLVGSWMVISGLLMHRQLEGEWIPKIDMIMIRELHNTVSQLFVIIFALQLLTGIILWGIPEILKRNSTKKTK